MEISPDMVAAGSIENTSQRADAGRADLQPAEQAIDAASAPFLGRWQRLVSTTNWEKGRIIFEWRDALIAADRPAAEFADDAWASQVGNVTSQHVGRLRRVYARFGAAHASYEGLFWSHFQAAVDWEDAEMWLEGALQNDWSVNSMRLRRAETLGDSASNIDLASLDQNGDGSPVDDDAEGAGDPQRSGTTNVIGATADRIDDSEYVSAGSSAGERAENESSAEDSADAAPWEDGSDADAAAVERVVRQPFAALPELPDDLQAAFDSFKIAILRHRRENWQLVTPSDVAATLDGLKELALSPLDA
jgi:hypothetical protein